MSSFGIALIVWQGSSASPSLFAGLLAVAVLAGAGSGVFRPVHRAAWRSVVDKKAVPDLVAKLQGTSALTMMVGPPAGGLLYSLYTPSPFLLDGISFLVASALIGTAGLPARSSLAQESTGASTWADLKEGFAFVRGNRPLLDINVVSALLSFAGTGFFISLVLYADELGWNAFTTSLLQAAAAAGVIAGAVATPALLGRFRVGTLACVLPALGTASFLLVTSVARDPYVAVLVPVVTLFVPVLVSAYSGYEALVTPDHLQARVTSVGDFLSEGLSPAAPVVGGILVAAIGGTETLLAFTGVFALGTLMTLASRQLRGLPIARSAAELTPKP
jgi:hypothetical protein